MISSHFILAHKTQNAKRKTIRFEQDNTDSLFEAYKNDPNSVEKSWREYFDKYHGILVQENFSKIQMLHKMYPMNALKMISDATNLLKLVRAIKHMVII